ncbi:hypothetical protein FV113G1_22000 [Fusobacterium varium]|nr:hypothetical protein FV113G1_22000 [Fusobacterium varium]
MEIILNELSIKNISEFKELKGYISILKLNEKLDEIVLLKKSDCYNYKTNIDGKTWSNILTDSRDDHVKRIKLYLAKLLKPPYWDLTSKQTKVHYYHSEWTNEKENYGIAEASERDKIIFSFLNDCDTSIRKENSCEEGSIEEIIIKNVQEKNKLLEILFFCDVINFEVFLKHYEFKNYKFIENEKLLNSIPDDKIVEFVKDCLNNEKREDCEDFNGFTTPPADIYRSENFYIALEKTVKLHKYRINQKIRCWGYKSDDNKFVPVYYEADHGVSG